MKYIAIRIDDNTVHLPNLITEDQKNSMSAATYPEDLWFIEVADSYDTTEIFDTEPIIDISTAEDKDNPVAIADCTINKNYTQFNKWIDSETSVLIKQWCADNGKNEEYYQRLGIENGNTDVDFVSYKNEVATRITAQALLKK